MNTAIAAMMTAVNEMTANGATRGDMGVLLRLLNPFAPHITEELWEQLGFAAQSGKMCCQAEWPVYDASKTVASSVEIAIQVNGKMKGTVTMAVDSDEESVKAAALAVEKVQKATAGMQVVKTILRQEPPHQPDCQALLRHLTSDGKSSFLHFLATFCTFFKKSLTFFHRILL